MLTAKFPKTFILNLMFLFVFPLIIFELPLNINKHILEFSYLILFTCLETFVDIYGLNKSGLSLLFLIKKYIINLNFNAIILLITSYSIAKLLPALNVLIVTLMLLFFIVIISFIELIVDNYTDKKLK